MCTSRKIANEIIMIPGCLTGEPNWDYMKQYMKQIMGQEKAITNSFLNIYRK